MEIKKPKRWDKKWRIIIFDIPLKKNIARDVLRRKLKELKFEQIQKSIFVHPYDCEDIINIIKELYGVYPYVKLIVAERIEGQEKLIKKFSLDKYY